MLDLGVIEYSHSAWYSPIILVTKTDKSTWLCVNYLCLMGLKRNRKQTTLYFLKLLQSKLKPSTIYAYVQLT